MKRNRLEVTNRGRGGCSLKINLTGNRRAISTSKIRKIIAIRKNRREKGRRELFFGSNPDSKGDDFSRSVNLFLDSEVAAAIKITLRRKAIITDAISGMILTSSSVNRYKQK